MMDFWLCTQLLKKRLPAFSLPSSSFAVAGLLPVKSRSAPAPPADSPPPPPLSFKHFSTFRAWSCAENIPDMWRAPGIQWACSALPPAGKRKLVHIRVIPGIVGVSAQWTRSGLWAARARLCPRKWASGFPSLLLSYVEERPVKTSETIF